MHVNESKRGGATVSQTVSCLVTARRSGLASTSAKPFGGSMPPPRQAPNQHCCPSLPPPAGGRPPLQGGGDQPRGQRVWAQAGDRGAGPPHSLAGRAPAAGGESDPSGPPPARLPVLLPMPAARLPACTERHTLPASDAAQTSQCLNDMPRTLSPGRRASRSWRTRGWSWTRAAAPSPTCPTSEADPQPRCSVAYASFTSRCRRPRLCVPPHGRRQIRVLGTRWLGLARPHKRAKQMRAFPGTSRSLHTSAHPRHVPSIPHRPPGPSLPQGEPDARQVGRFWRRRQD